MEKAVNEFSRDAQGRLVRVEVDIADIEGSIAIWQLDDDTDQTSQEDPTQFGGGRLCL